jgi:hypothetical protein
MLRKMLVVPLLLTSFVVQAGDSPFKKSNSARQYSECIGVSLNTRDSKQVNAITEAGKGIEDATHIPDGWSVIGVATKKEALITAPYLVICH